MFHTEIKLTVFLLTGSVGFDDSALIKIEEVVGWFGLEPLGCYESWQVNAARRAKKTKQNKKTQHVYFKWLSSAGEFNLMMMMMMIIEGRVGFATQLEIWYMSNISNSLTINIEIPFSNIKHCQHLLSCTTEMCALDIYGVVEVANLTSMEHWTTKWSTDMYFSMLAWCWSMRNPSNFLLDIYLLWKHANGSTALN